MLQTFVIGLLLSSIWNHTAVAQQKHPVHLVSIRFAQFAGFTDPCSYGRELTVSADKAVLLRRTALECKQRDPKRYPDLRVEADLSGKHWKELQQLVDRETFLALPQNLGCASCSDGVDELIEMKFSDHSIKSVQYPAGSAPQTLRALSERLSALVAKLDDELANRQL